MPDIYEMHDKAFASISAYIIVKDGERVATIAFKFPKDGAGRLYAYVHWLGTEMARGQASGYGYDKRSAAVANAVGKLIVPAEMEALKATDMHKFLGALESDGGEYWDTRLRTAGFEVWQAV